MSEETAWKNFAFSGSVEDYLIYRQAKNSNSQDIQKDPEEQNDSYDKGIDPETTGIQRKRCYYHSAD